MRKRMLEIRRCFVCGYVLDSSIKNYSQVMYCEKHQQRANQAFTDTIRNIRNVIFTPHRWLNYDARKYWGSLKQPINITSRRESE